MEMTFTYWQDGDMYLGYLNAYPDYPTQGHTLDELKVMLADILADVENDPEMRKTRRNQGVLDGAK